MGNCECIIFFITDAIEALNKKLDMLKIHVVYLSVLHNSMPYKKTLFDSVTLSKWIGLTLQAHEQLRAVLQTLLEELPSDLPILLLGTSAVPLSEIEDLPSSVFSHCSVYVFSNFVSNLQI